jgi:hypothetical protein
MEDAMDDLNFDELSQETRELLDAVPWESAECVDCGQHHTTRAEANEHEVLGHVVLHKKARSVN